MPTLITKTVEVKFFQFEELEPDVQEKVLSRIATYEMESLYDEVDILVDQMAYIAEQKGYLVGTRSVPLYGGGTRREPYIEFNYYHGSISFEADIDLHTVLARYGEAEKLHHNTLRMLERMGQHWEYEVRVVDGMIQVNATTSSEYHQEALDIFVEWLYDDLRELCHEMLQTIRDEEDYRSSSECALERIHDTGLRFTEDGQENYDIVTLEEIWAKEGENDQHV